MLTRAALPRGLGESFFEKRRTLLPGRRIVSQPERSLQMVTITVYSTINTHKYVLSHKHWTQFKIA